MSDAIKGGMYSGDNIPGKQISIDRRLVKIRDDDGQYVDVPSTEYVRDLERQILELKKTVAILVSENKAQDSHIKRIAAGIRKVDSKLS